MPLTESSKKFFFGTAEPQQMRDYSGPSGSLQYEGYATPGISTAAMGWVIVKHSFDANGADNQTQPKSGLIWDLRTVYNYANP